MTTAGMHTFQFNWTGSSGTYAIDAAIWGPDHVRIDHVLIAGAVARVADLAVLESTDATTLTATLKAAALAAQPTAG